MSDPAVYTDRGSGATVAAPFEPQRAPLAAPRHLKVTGAGPAFGFEPCEDAGCSVAADGTASSCDRTACPVCGCGGTNLSTIALVDSLTRVRIRCSCGHSWLRSDRLAYGLSLA